MSREEAKEHILASCGKGWLPLIDEIYDQLPKHIRNTEVFQKWGGLTIRTSLDDEAYDAFLLEIEERSRFLCEICGEKGFEAIIDEWVTTI